MRTAALVGTTGSIDWLCFPHFDSPSVFAALLDSDKGGQFQVAPTTEHYRSTQRYWPDSNVLVTRFLSRSGVAEVTELHASRCEARTASAALGPPGARHPRHHDAARAVRSRFRFRPAVHRLEAADGGVVFRSPLLDLALGSDVPLQIEGGAAAADFSLEEGEEASFVLGEPDTNSGARSGSWTLLRVPEGSTRPAWTRPGSCSRACSATRTTWGSSPRKPPCSERLWQLPQAFTHLALISAAFNLDRALDAQ